MTHYNMITITLSGKKIINHRGKSWLMTSDTGLFVRRTAFNQEMFYKSEWEILAFYFQDDFLISVFNEYRSFLPVNQLPATPADMLLPFNVNTTTAAFSYSIVPYFNQRPQPSESLIELKFKELLFLLLSNPLNTSLLAYAKSISENNKTPLRDIMEANYTFNLSLADFARIGQSSLASFKREFEQIYKMTPGKWLTQKKLEYAVTLLNTTAKNMNEIAYDSGFENATHFNRIFKEKYGLPPLQYRKKTSNLIAI